MVLHLHAVGAHGLGLHQRPAVFFKEFPRDMAGLNGECRKIALSGFSKNCCVQTRRHPVAFAVRAHIGHVELAFWRQGEKPRQSLIIFTDQNDLTREALGHESRTLGGRGPGLKLRRVISSDRASMHSVMPETAQASHVAAMGEADTIGHGGAPGLG